MDDRDNEKILEYEYNSYEKVGEYIYFYKDNELIAVYNPFVGLMENHKHRSR